MTDREMLDAMNEMLIPVRMKLEGMAKEIAGVKLEVAGMKYEMIHLDNRMTNMEYEMRRGFRRNNEEIETLVAVLHAKGLLPVI
ncbi:hypothetical protein D3Z55_14575 [Clostridiaceae bacterium]|nr:hypothetical protein [Clostridiaceae bacterium]